MTYYNSLRRANIERQAEYDPEHRISLLYRSNEFAGEAGELCNKIKKYERELLGLPGTRIHPDEIAGEMADAAITLDMLAMEMGVDLQAAIALKFNAVSSALNLQTKLKFEFDLSHKEDVLRTQIYNATVYNAQNGRKIG